jgi:hypothetical protein
MWPQRLVLVCVAIACHDISSPEVKQEDAAMIRFAILSLAALVASGAGPAFAQEPVANRFTLEKTGNGFVRMDTETGEMSICTEREGQLVCRLAADERRAFEETLSDLSDRVAALEQRLDIGTPGETTGRHSR